MPFRAWISWSSGKDSTFALRKTLDDPGFEITGMLTTLNEAFHRVAMHSVRESLLDRQSQMIGLPLYKIKHSRRLFQSNL
jgi:diphthamide synthase (EF-2-diphthine--ammonia ligase)